jgi:hypothetical protein
LEFVEILIFITVDIFKHTAKKNKKIKPADQILPEVYGTTLNGWRSDNTMAKRKRAKKNPNNNDLQNATQKTTD